MALRAEHIDFLDDIAFDPKNPSGEQTWLVSNVNSDEGIDREDLDDVVQKVLNVSPTFLIFPVPNIHTAIPNALLGRIHRLKVDAEWINHNEAKAVVSYGHVDRIPNETIGGENPTKNEEDGGQGGNEIYGPEWEIDISPSSVHITQLDETMLGGTQRMLRRFAKNIDGTAVSHLGGAIGVSRGKVQGVDIGAERVTRSLSMIGIPVTPNYVRYLRGMLLNVNVTKVFNFEPEELLFLGAKLRSKAGEGWNGTFNFAEGRNLTNVRIGGNSDGTGGVVIPEVKAFDYVWCTYRDVTESGVLIQKPAAVYCDRLYFTAEFAGLFTGTL